MNIYLDAEMIPGQDPSVRAALLADAEREKESVKAPANYKDEAKIAEYVATKRAEVDAAVDERWRKTALDGMYGQIVAIAFAVDDEDAVSFVDRKWVQKEFQYRYSQDSYYCINEADILEKMFFYIDSTYKPKKFELPTIIGHNIVGFDLPFIFKRAVLLGVRIPEFIPINPGPRDVRVFDTMTAWAGYGGRVSLSALCAAFGLPPKGSEIGEEIDGSKVWDYVQDGRIDDVAAYCRADVERVRAIHKRIVAVTQHRSGE